MDARAALDGPWPDESSLTWTKHLRGCGPEVLSVVRAWIRGLVADLADAYRSDAVLVGVELVTNAIEHGGGPQWIRLARHDDRGLLRIEVADDNLGQLTFGTSRFGPAAHRGNGLVLIGGLSRDWGVHRDDLRGCKTVWTTLVIGPGSADGAGG